MYSTHNEGNQGLCISWPPALCLALVPGPGSWPQSPTLTNNLYLPTVAPNLSLWSWPPNLYFPALP